ncbi:MAG: flavodoxin family protein [Desulfobacterota bacterium]|nr:flavodoxin family protein [Thermodesulfobacteriota bacterium]
MRITAFAASPRSNGNSTLLLREVLRGAQEAGYETETFSAHALRLKACKGCLRCNIIGRCAQRGDEWQHIARSILDADRIVFATPVYFHHVPAALKSIIDRFRSFLQVRVTETGLEHKPWALWQKEFILLLSLGSSSTDDCNPIIDLFSYMVDVLGTGNTLTVVKAPRLVVPGQLRMSAKELAILYRKLGLAEHLAEQDAGRNRELLNRCYQIGLKRESYNS